MRASAVKPLACLALLLLASPARTEPPPWAFSMRTAYAVLGPRERPTGGMLLAVDAARSWPIGASGAVDVGVGLGAFGFDTGTRWTAILGGPAVAARAAVSRSWALGLAVHLDAGRLPTCTRWGLCMLYTGLFPAFAGTIRYSPSERVAFDLVGSARAIRTLAWNGAAGEFGLAGTVGF